jgi:hypothetical protein
VATSYRPRVFWRPRISGGPRSCWRLRICCWPPRIRWRTGMSPPLAVTARGQWSARLSGRCANGWGGVVAVARLVHPGQTVALAIQVWWRSTLTPRPSSVARQSPTSTGTGSSVRRRRLSEARGRDDSAKVTGKAIAARRREDKVQSSQRSRLQFERQDMMTAQRRDDHSHSSWRG